jgi:predicted transcriptional regulator
MRTYDGNDIKYYLAKRGYKPRDVARELKVSPPMITQAIWGGRPAKRIIAHIEMLLGMKPGTLRIMKRKQASTLRAA